MATHTYWIPCNHSRLPQQANETGDYLSAPSNRERMGLAQASPQGQWLDMEFFPKLRQLNEAFLDWLDPSQRTSVKTTHLFSVEKEFKPVYRNLYIGFLKSNPLVTVTDLVAMGLPKPHDHVSNHTPPLPHSCPFAHVVLPGIARIAFYTRNSDNSRAKPAGIHSVELKWDILDKPPANVADMRHTSSFTKSPFILQLDNQSRGKTLYFVLRWENTRSEKGPWGPIQNTIIP